PGPRTTGRARHRRPRRARRRADRPGRTRAPPPPSGLQSLNRPRSSSRAATSEGPQGGRSRERTLMGRGAAAGSPPPITAGAARGSATAADRPGARALLAQQPRGHAVLLGLGGLRGIALAAQLAPRLHGELVLA